MGPGQPTVCSVMSSENASERFVTNRERPCKKAPSNNTSNEDPVTYCHEETYGANDHLPNVSCVIIGSGGSVVVMPQSYRRNRRCALSTTDMHKPEEKDARSVTCFMGENVISPREVVIFNEHIRN